MSLDKRQRINAQAMIKPNMPLIRLATSERPKLIL
jgi:hypothetical protein